VVQGAAWAAFDSSRGTAIGILLPLLKILARDRLARIVVLPSEHFVRDEAGLARSLRLAASLTETPESNLVLLGIGPDHPNPEFGYIVPGRPDRHGTFRVQRFVEKPDGATAVTGGFRLATTRCTHARDSGVGERRALLSTYSVSTSGHAPSGRSSRAMARSGETRNFRSPSS
jgi:hypothetical protein